MQTEAYFTSGSLQFLKELRDHNNREWFEGNRARYENQVRDPFLRLIADLHAPLKKINPSIIVDPRPTGGSMMRIYRDIRFSPDKSPYKTAVAAHFSSSKGTDGCTAAYYLRIEPGNSMTGGGLWHPDSAALGKIREAIVTRPSRWQHITSGAQFGTGCGMTGESLKKPPRGFDPNHPLIEDLKRKDFVIGSPLTDQEVCASELLDRIVDAFRISTPFMDFLAGAVESAGAETNRPADTKPSGRTTNAKRRTPLRPKQMA